MLRGLIEDALHLAPIDVECAGYGALAMTVRVPGPDGLVQAWRSGRRQWHIAAFRLRTLARRDHGGEVGGCVVAGTDERHKEFEGAGQRHGGPRTDQGTYRTVAQPVCQVGASRGRDARTKAPARQGWYALAAPVGVEGEHARGQDEAVDGERYEPGGQG